MLKDKDTQSKSKSSTCLATQSKQEQLIKLHKLTSYTRISTTQAQDIDECKYKACDLENANHREE